MRTTYCHSKHPSIPSEDQNWSIHRPLALDSLLWAEAFLQDGIYGQNADGKLTYPVGIFGIAKKRSFHGLEK